MISMKCFNYLRCIVHSSDGEELFLQPLSTTYNSQFSLL